MMISIFSSSSINRLGGLITFLVYASLGFKQILSEEEERQSKQNKRLSSNLHPEDVKMTKKKEILCIAFINHDNRE